MVKFKLYFTEQKVVLSMFSQVAFSLASELPIRQEDCLGTPNESLNQETSNDPLFEFEPKTSSPRARKGTFPSKNALENFLSSALDSFEHRSYFEIEISRENSPLGAIALEYSSGLSEPSLDNNTEEMEGIIDGLQSLILKGPPPNSPDSPETRRKCKNTESSTRTFETKLRYGEKRKREVRSESNSTEEIQSLSDDFLNSKTTLISNFFIPQTRVMRSFSVPEKPHMDTSALQAGLIKRRRTESLSTQ
ncbi:hypothetical protein JQC92_06285 [Shewanella sp. 202IG2-18]|uniref:hypothetical protein n=1 Tax=Parashewanella hymeniacidonis TaxID=2807618 RepID=UPI00195FF80E|nr:hypothetical protein [Parashewanella hymeniacidonis]MBM7071648.1 hypothetical protein [Parashewanella hymeniacidonis]